MPYQQLILLATGTIGPIFLAVVAFSNRKRVYATWAKLAYVLASLAGLAWGVLGLIVWPSFHVVRRAHFFPVPALRYLLAGIAIGFLASVLMARPYEDRDQ